MQTHTYVWPLALSVWAWELFFFFRPCSSPPPHPDKGGLVWVWVWGREEKLTRLRVEGRGWWRVCAAVWEWVRGKNEHNMKCWGRKKRTLKYAFSSALNLRDSLWGHNLKRRGPRIRVFMFLNAFSSIPLIHELKYSNIDFPHTASLKNPSAGVLLTLMAVVNGEQAYWCCLRVTEASVFHFTFIETKKQREGLKGTKP